jgi:hypothetical protein
MLLIDPCSASPLARTDICWLTMLLRAPASRSLLFMIWPSAWIVCAYIVDADWLACI